jgi:hypothetical protein
MKRKQSNNNNNIHTWFKWFLFAMVAFSAVSVNAAAEEKKEDYGTVIGIDLGTTYSCVGGASHSFYCFHSIVHSLDSLSKGPSGNHCQ